METIVHIALSEKYVEGLSYQENLLSKKHSELGYDVYMITSQSYYSPESIIVTRPTGMYTNKDGVKVIILPDITTNHFIRKFCFFVYGLYDTLCKLHPDVIFIHGLFAHDNITIRKYKMKYPNVAVYADNHDDYYNSPIIGLRGGIRKFLARVCAKELSGIVSMYWGTTPWRVQYIKELFRISDDKIGLLLMGADESLIEGKDIKR